MRKSIGEPPRAAQAIDSLAPKSTVRRALGARARLVLVTLVVAFAADALGADLFASGFRSLPDAVSEQGLLVTRDESRALLSQRTGSSKQLVVFRAVERLEESASLGDVWAADAVVSPQGRVANMGRARNLTRTSSADETSPIILGHWALFSRRIEGRFVGLELFDLAGEPPTQKGPLSRVQRGLSNLQQTGQWAGIGKRSYTFKLPVTTLSIHAEEHRFQVHADGDLLRIDPVHEKPLEGSFLVDVRSPTPSVNALVPWLVDAVREISWIGPEKIAWLENKVFALRDQAKRAYHSVNEVDHAAEAALDLGIAEHPQKEEEEKVERLSVPDPESGWPPAPLDVLIPTPEVAGEGKWRAIIDDPYVRELPDGSPVFFQTFLRADPQRDWARVYLTLWDPRLVQLHVVAGTEEPLSATGETGTGMIPRKPEVLRRLVGAFNGGFQAVHGEFGMMADGRVYLPPKPWAATVAVFSDGRVGMGSWPGPEDRRAGYDEARAVAQIPDGMVSYRQNLTSLVEDGRFNPWNRWWWGAAPKQQSEQTLTQRSALCITREGFMLYAWGDSASPEALGAALVAARCVRAMHLDMNAGHSGMEFYNMLAPDEARMPIEKRVPSSVEKPFSALTGYTLRARKMVTSMGIALPRYVFPDPRDYFYLTIKPGLVGTALPGEQAAFDSKDLPHAGWPPAFARKMAEGVRVLRIDPARALPRVEPPAGGQLALATLRGAPQPDQIDDFVLYVERKVTGTHYKIGVPPPGADALLRGPQLRAGATVQAALGVDGDGLLLYVEVDQAKTGAAYEALAAFGVRDAIALPREAKLGLSFKEGVLGVDGRSRIRESQSLLHFIASSAPATEVLFPDNEPIPYARWANLQNQRVRYFRTGEPTARAPEGALEEPAK